MQRETTKKRQRKYFRQHPTDRMEHVSDSVGHDQNTTIRSDGAQTDRMAVTAVTSFSFMDEFTPHNHVWLIISA